MNYLLYDTLRPLVRVALAVYFSRIEIEGEEDVPDGPIVIAATHPNAFIDVALVATRLRRRIGFVGKAPLFKNPIAGAFLRSFGAVPVERRQEREGASNEAGAQEKNAKSLAACEELVASGGGVLIFPEGTSEFGPKLLPLKTGVARIAFGAEERRKKGDVAIVPVAVRYDDPTSFRSRARVSFLAAIPVAPYLEMHAKDPKGAVHALTDAVRDSLEATVVHVKDDALAPIVAEIDAIYGSHLAVAQTGGARLAAAPAIAAAVNAFAQSSPERVAAMKEKIARYQAALAKAGVDDTIVRPMSKRPNIGETVSLLLATPVAAWGILHHYIPYQVPRVVVAALVKDETFVSTVKLITGTIVFTALYVGEGLAAGYWFGVWVGLVLALSLPVSGVIALEVIEAWQARLRRRHRRARRASLPPEALKELEALRAGVVLELDRARADFLLAHPGPAPEEGLA
jgi:1-acyl-sn-glycerol-3-phosphate acyltransferase